MLSDFIFDLGDAECSAVQSSVVFLPHLEIDLTVIRRRRGSFPSRGGSWAAPTFGVVVWVVVGGIASHVLVIRLIVLWYVEGRVIHGIRGR
jgi:hypothetical protein